jgi:Arm DNA-binding domain
MNPGGSLRMYPTGRKVYAMKCRVGRVQSIHTIGEHGSPWTPDEARKAALEALGRARRGEDPNAEKKAAKAALTVSDLIDRYLSDGPATKPAKRAKHLGLGRIQPQPPHPSPYRSEGD